MDRQCLPKNKASLLTCEDIALRRQQVRQKLAEFTLQQEQGKICEVEEQAKPKEVIEEQVKANEVFEEAPVFVAFARVFSGTLRRGQELYVLGPKYDPSTTEGDIDPNLTLKVSKFAIEKEE